MIANIPPRLQFDQVPRHEYASAAWTALRSFASGTQATSAPTRRP